ncbi:hypothetical protein M426DRAFT_325964 [Hypoxylon sp. CI-4A]|nr:hypothetical protein M426DRAFT_325964 [Hypoxylon sp. CI-4A]
MELDSTGSAHVVVPGTRKSVPYGQACTNCSKAKCKCISRSGPGATTCERCQRLGKECVPSVSVRKRAARRPASERTAHLEEKLDDLVSILRAQAAGNPATGVGATSYRSPSSGDLPSAAVSVDSNPGSSMELDPSVTAISDAGKIVNVEPSIPPSAETSFCDRYMIANSYPTPPTIPSSQAGDLSPADAEETLRVFKEDFLGFFPFVYISPETTAAHLQQTRPFLWLNILTVCCKSSKQKAAYGQKIREYVAQKMLVDLDRNVDMLLGILAFIGWGMHHFNGKPYILAFVNTAQTLVADLRLDKPPQDHFYREIHCFKPSTPYPKLPYTGNRTDEERRAVLACFIISSGISNFLRTQTMRWTPHMEDSLQKIATNPECLNDEILVAMVKSYRIQEEVAQITWRAAELTGHTIAPKAPPAIYLKALRSHLEAVRRDISPELSKNKVVLSHLYAAELSIADMSLWNVNPWLISHPHKPSQPPGLHHHNNNSSSSNNQTPSPSSSWNVDFGKIDAYYASLSASKASVENFLSFAPADYMSLSFSLTLHFGRAAQTLYRLMVVDDPEWDRGVVKRSIDLMASMRRVADLFLAVPRVCGFETGDDDESMDYYTKASNALRATIPSWCSTLEQMGVPVVGGGGGDAPANPAAAAEQIFPPGSIITEFTTMDWLDDPWLTEMMKAWEGT